MVELSAEEIGQRAFDLNLLDERGLRDIWDQLGTRSASAEEFKQALLRAELLTNYQVERLMRGERTGYFYGNYKIQYQIGTGTFARVYRAVHVQTGEIMAVKVLRKRFNEEKEQRDQFMQEAKVGQLLRHPNIVPIYEAEASRSGSYMVMEFVEGRNLREFMKIRKKLTPEEATRLTCDMAAGLDYSFQKGISHRDLKMSNVLISSTGRAKLLDFGLAGADANLSDEALADMANPRTVDYVALERASNVRRDDNRSDIFFLGGMFYQMLSGVPPLAETKDRIQRLSKSRFMEIVPIWDIAPDIPRGIAAVVAKAMQLDPEQRYQSPGEMLRDLRRAEKAPADDPALAGDNGAVPERQPVLMIVESGTTMQNMLREQLKKSGYKVLVTSDARRPLSWFNEREKPADCVLFSTANLGQRALETFNEFGANSLTASIPAVLLLGPKHVNWNRAAKVSDHRKIVNTPIKLRELRMLLGKLLNHTDSANDPEAMSSEVDAN